METNPPPPFSSRRLLLWIGSHAALLPLLAVLLQGPSSAQNDGYALFAMPLSLALIETLLLLPWLRRRWTWVPLTLLGLVLAFFIGLGWFFLLAIGFGLGLAQIWPLHRAGFRWAPLWFFCSGFGWLGGCLLAIPLEDVLRDLIHDTATVTSNILMPGLVGLCYGAAQGLYLFLAQPKAPASTASAAPGN